MKLEVGGNQLQLSIDNTNSVAREEAAARTISAELLAYIGLALIALMLRITALGSVPISDFEAVQALHAWHTIEDDAPGQYMVSSSPLTYITQLITFSTLGASEFAARIGSAFAGFALALAPLLFRDSLGRTRTFVWAALLSLLTVPIASSRVADGTAFMMLFTLLAIWMIRRYWYSRQLSDALMAIAFVTFMVLLSSPSGIPLLVILLVSGWMAVWRTALSAPERLDLPGDDILRMAVRRLHDFPFAKVAFVPLLVVGITATLFMLNPAGLRTVSHLAGEAISGITQSYAIDRRPPGIRRIAHLRATADHLRARWRLAALEKGRHYLRRSLRRCLGGPWRGRFALIPRRETGRCDVGRPATHLIGQLRHHAIDGQSTRGRTLVEQ